MGDEEKRPGNWKGALAEVEDGLQAIDGALERLQKVDFEDARLPDLWLRAMQGCLERIHAAVEHIIADIKDAGINRTAQARTSNGAGAAKGSEEPMYLKPLSKVLKVDYHIVRRMADDQEFET